MFEELDKYKTNGHLGFSVNDELFMVFCQNGTKSFSQ
jgi:hypothetical protein